MASVTPIDIIVYSFSANGVLDDASPMYAYVKVPSVITSVTNCAVSLAFRQFSSNSKSAASGSESISGGGGSTSGSSSASTSGAETGHNHMFGAAGATMGTSASRDYDASDSAGAAAAVTFRTTTDSAANLYTYNGSGHTHGISHTHSTPSHTHTVTGHTHALVYGTYEESYPASHSVWLKVYKRIAGVWTLQGTTANQTADLADLDLTSLITGPGDYQLRVQSNAGQPNSGRLGLDLYGAITAQIG